MNEDFDKFYERKLWSARIGAEGATWFCAGLVTGLIAGLLPEASCPISAFYNEFDMGEIRQSLCESATINKVLPIVWLGLAGLRALCLASSRHTDPILSMENLKIEREDGQPITLMQTMLYALLEWLPIHFLSLYILIYGIKPNLYDLGSAASLTLTAQALWLTPFITKTCKKNIPDTLTGIKTVFTDKGKGKVRQQFQKRKSRIFSTIGHHIDHTAQIIFVLLLIVISIQILRAPEINADYERLIYADNEPVWDNNIYFAITGLKAPANISNSTAYGHAKTLQNFKIYEELKAHADIPYPYPMPAEAPDASSLQKNQEISFKGENWKNFGCLTDPEYATAECATENDVQSYINENRILWDRFNALPDNMPYYAIPRPMGTPIDDFIKLALLKSAQIVILAKSGQSAESFNDWYKYMKLYRSMASARETLVFKAAIAIVLRNHINALQQLIYLHPDLASTRQEEISKALQPAGIKLFHEDRMNIDDIALVEPIFLSISGNVHAIRNDFYDCLAEMGAMAQLPARKFPFEDKDELLCAFAAKNQSYFKYPLIQPGYFVGNIVANLTYGGFIMNKSLAVSIKLVDVQMRMALLATQILDQNVPLDNISAFIASVSPELQNPITRKPFEWDADTKSLYFVRPDSGAEVKFSLNL